MGRLVDALDKAIADAEERCGITPAAPLAMAQLPQWPAWPSGYQPPTDGWPPLGTPPPGMTQADLGQAASFVSGNKLSYDVIDVMAAVFVIMSSAGRMPGMPNLQPPPQPTPSGPPVPPTPPVTAPSASGLTLDDNAKLHDDDMGDADVDCALPEGVQGPSPDIQEAAKITGRIVVTSQEAHAFGRPAQFEEEWFCGEDDYQRVSVQDMANLFSGNRRKLAAIWSAAVEIEDWLNKAKATGIQASSFEVGEVVFQKEIQ